MAKIIQFPKKRCLPRKSGDHFRVVRKDKYKVKIRAILPSHSREKAVRQLYGHGFHLMHCLGGFNLSKGFTKSMIRCGNWHTLPERVRPDPLRDFLEAVDDYCERGWLEVSVEGKIMSKSRLSVSKA